MYYVLYRLGEDIAKVKSSYDTIDFVRQNAPRYVLILYRRRISYIAGHYKGVILSSFVTEYYYVVNLII